MPAFGSPSSSSPSSDSRSREADASGHAEDDSDAASPPSHTAPRATAVLAHELRTPLTTIIGMAEAIENEPDMAEEFAPLIRQSGQRLHRLLNALLNLSKLQAGVQVLTYEWTDVRPLVQQALDGLMHDADQKGLPLHTSIHPRPLVAQIDPIAVGQVATNLVSNAIRYTQAGCIDVRLISHQRHFSLEVADTGPGIAPEIRDTLFTPFVNYTADPDIPSSGLGLAITWHLVDQMGGTIAVDTVLDAGTTFRVDLPRSRHYAPVAPTPEDNVPEGSASPPPSNGPSSPDSSTVDGSIETLMERLRMVSYE